MAKCDYILSASQMGNLIAQIGIASIKLKSREVEAEFCARLDELEKSLSEIEPTLYEVAE